MSLPRRYLQLLLCECWKALMFPHKGVIRRKIKAFVPPSVELKGKYRGLTYRDLCLMAVVARVLTLGSSCHLEQPHRVEFFTCLSSPSAWNFVWSVGYQVPPLLLAANRMHSCEEVAANHSYCINVARHLCEPTTEFNHWFKWLRSWCWLLWYFLSPLENLLKWMKLSCYQLCCSKGFQLIQKHFT